MALIPVAELESYIAKLKVFDWYYEFSDDGAVWRAGKKSYEALKEQARSNEWLGKAFRMYSGYMYHSTPETGPRIANAMQELINELKKAHLEELITN